MSERSNGPAGTTDQKPRWEGPPENRPRGYMPAKDDPETDSDVAGETLPEFPDDEHGGGDDAQR